MANKKINQLTALTDDQVKEDARVLAIADGTTGVAGKGTMAQVKLAIRTFKHLYVADGTEGDTLEIPEIAGMELLAVFREGSFMYEVESSPDEVEYIWDGTFMTLGTDAGEDERFLVLYRKP